MDAASPTSSRTVRQPQTFNDANTPIASIEDTGAPSFSEHHSAKHEDLLFYKRWNHFGNVPQFDVLLQTGCGTHLPDKQTLTPTARTKKIIKVGDDLYVYENEMSPKYRVFESIATTQYKPADTPRRITYNKHAFSQKTVGFLSTMGGGDIKNSQIPEILKLIISGDDQWAGLAKRTAKLLKVNIEQGIFDGRRRQVTEEHRGSWAAGHIEKKLAVFCIWILFKRYKIKHDRDGDNNMCFTKEGLEILRNQIQRVVVKPQFRIHLNREPCGTASGNCVGFLKRLTAATGVIFIIQVWDFVLDESLPPPKPPKMLEGAQGLDEDGQMDGNNTDDDDYKNYIAELKGREEDIIILSFQGQEQIKIETPQMGADKNEDMGDMPEYTNTTNNSYQDHLFESRSVSEFPSPPLHTMESALSFGTSFKDHFQYMPQQTTQSKRTQTQAIHQSQGQHHSDGQMVHIDNDWLTQLRSGTLINKYHQGIARVPIAPLPSRRGEQALRPLTLTDQFHMSAFEAARMISPK